MTRKGDAEAADRVRRAASSGQNICDREERNVKIEALSDDGFSVALPIPPIVALVLERSDARTGPVKRSGGRAAG